MLSRGPKHTTELFQPWPATPGASPTPCPGTYLSSAPGQQFLCKLWYCLVCFSFFLFFFLSLFSIIFFGLIFGLILDLSCHCRSLPQLLDGGWSPVFDLALHCVPDMTSDVSCWMLIAVDADACSPSSAIVGWALALWGMLLNPCPYFL